MTVKKIVICLFIFMLSSVPAFSQNNVKTKFYNFDDLLIDGKVRKPQLLWVDTRQKVKFERLLKLRKDFLPKLKATRKDAALR